MGSIGNVNNSNENSICPPSYCIVWYLCRTLDYTNLSRECLSRSGGDVNMNFKTDIESESVLLAKFVHTNKECDSGVFLLSMCKK